MFHALVFHTPNAVELFFHGVSPSVGGCMLANQACYIHIATESQAKRHCFGNETAPASRRVEENEKKNTIPNLVI